MPPLLRSLARCSGPGAENAQRCAQALIALKVNALVSFGVAGALSPDLKVGDVVLVSEIIERSTGQKIPVNQLNSNQHPKMSMVSVEAPVLQAQSKSTLAHQTGAHAVDMESAAIAKVALQSRVPFYCVRVISDSSGTNLPEEVLALMHPQAKPTTIMKAILKRPGLLVDLIKMGIQFQRALGELKKESLKLLALSDQAIPEPQNG